MTLDTATLRAQWEAIREQQGPAAFAMIAHVGDGIALLDALDAMRTERDSWQADVESLHGDLAHSMDRIAEEMAAVEAERERVRVLVEALRAVEWEQNDDGSPWRDPPRWFYCPSCGNVKNTREEVGIHAPGCALAAALATAGGEGATT